MIALRNYKVYDRQNLDITLKLGYEMFLRAKDFILIFLLFLTYFFLLLGKIGVFNRDFPLALA